MRYRFGRRITGISEAGDRCKVSVRLLVDNLDQGSDMIDGRMRQNAVSQVEDMAWASAGLPQDSAGLTLDLLERGEEDDGIEVPLHGDAVAKPCPSLVQLDAPIQADHRAPRIPLEVQQRARIGPEVDRGDRRIEPGEETCHVWLDEPPIVRRAESPNPAIENLQGLRPAAAWAFR